MNSITVTIFRRRLPKFPTASTVLFALSRWEIGYAPTVLLPFLWEGDPFPIAIDNTFSLILKKKSQYKNVVK